MSVIIRLQGLPWSASALDIRNFFQGLSIPAGGVHIIGGEKGDAFIAFSTDEDARQAMNKNFEMLSDSVIKLFLSSKTEMQNIIEQARAPIMNSGPVVPEASPKLPDLHGRAVDNEPYGPEPLTRENSWGPSLKAPFPRPDPGNVYKDSSSWYEGQNADFKKFPRNSDIYPDPGNYNYGQPDGDRLSKDTRAMPPEIRSSRPVTEPFMPGLKKDFRGPPGIKPADDTFPPDPRSKNWPVDFDGPLKRGPREDPHPGRYESAEGTHPRHDPWSQGTVGPEEPEEIPQFDEFGRQIFPAEKRSFPPKPGSVYKDAAGFIAGRKATDSFEPGFQKGRPFLDDPDLRKDSAVPPQAPKFGSDFADDRDFRNAPRTGFSRPNMDELGANASGNYPEYRPGFPRNQGAFPSDSFEAMNQVPGAPPRGLRPPFRPETRFGPGGRFEPRGRFPLDGPRPRFPADGPLERFPPNHSGEEFGQDDHYSTEGHRGRFRPDPRGTGYSPDGPAGRFPPDRFGRGPQPRMPADAITGNFPSDGQGDIPSGPGGRIPFGGPGGRFPPEGRGRGRPSGPLVRGPVPLMDKVLGPDASGRDVERLGFSDVPGSLTKQHDVNEKWKDGRPPYADHSVNKPVNTGKGLLGDAPVSVEAAPEDKDNRDHSERESRTMGRQMSSRGSDDGHFGGGYGRRGNSDGGRFSSRDTSYRERDDRSRSKGRNEDRDYDRRDSYYRSERRMDDHYRSSRYSDRDSRSYSDRDRDREQSRRDRESKSGSDRDRDSRPSQSKISSDRDSRGDSKSSGDKDSRSESRGSKRMRSDDIRGSFHVVLNSMSSEVSYREVRRFFAPIDIPFDGLKLINDERGRRTGQGYIKFASEMDLLSALKKSGTYMNDKKVDIQRCSKEDYEKAVDSFIPDSDSPSTPQKRLKSSESDTTKEQAPLATTPPYIAALKGLPPKITKEDIRHFLAGVNVVNDGDAIYIDIDQKGVGNGTAYIEVATPEDLKKVFACECRTMGPRLIRVTLATKDDISEVQDHRKKYPQFESNMGDFDNRKLDSSVTGKRQSDNDAKRMQSPIRRNDSDGRKSDETFFVRLSGLPPQCTQREIRDFCHGVTIAPRGLQICHDGDGKPTGEAFLEFQAKEQQERCKQLDKQSMGQHEITVETCTKGEMVSRMRQARLVSMYGPIGRNPMHGSVPPLMSDMSDPVGAGEINKPIPPGVLKRHWFYLRCSNLPLSVTIREILGFFQGHNPVPESIRLHYTGDGHPTGNAVVGFESREEAMKAMHELNNALCRQNQVVINPASY